uniref:Uncharacterized protein n=1 Tax=Romanomermis culicivorax TaxID=13658 RepID=A0A915IWN0_ROMCU
MYYMMQKVTNFKNNLIMYYWTDNPEKVKMSARKKSRFCLEKGQDYEDDDDDFICSSTETSPFIVHLSLGPGGP